MPNISHAMTRDDETATRPAPQTTAGIFVIHVRADSDLGTHLTATVLVTVPH